MQGEIIATGTELITGRMADFNARYAARRLHEAGLTVQRITILGDDSPLFQDLLLRGVDPLAFIIITGGSAHRRRPDRGRGGRGPGLGSGIHEELLARLRRCLGERQIPWEERYGRLALIPQGAQVLDPGGMACGFALKHGEPASFSCPGCPRRCGACSTPLCCPA